MFDFYPTCCEFSIPSPRLGDRKHTTRWMKITSQNMVDPIFIKQALQLIVCKIMKICIANFSNFLAKLKVKLSENYRVLK